MRKILDEIGKINSEHAFTKGDLAKHMNDYKSTFLNNEFFMDKCNGELKKFEKKGSGHGKKPPAQIGVNKTRQANPTPRKKTGACVDCDEYGHWKGHPVCKKVISGETPPYQPTALARRTRGTRTHRPRDTSARHAWRAADLKAATTRGRRGALSTRTPWSPTTQKVENPS